MIKKVRRRIITQTRQIAFPIDSAAEGDLRCELCGETTAMIPPLLAAKLLRISTREIYRFIETGKIHFVETPDSRIFVCSVSLERK